MMDGLRRQISPNNQWDIVEVPVTTTEVKEFMNALSDVWSFVLSMFVLLSSKSHSFEVHDRLILSRL